MIDLIFNLTQKLKEQGFSKGDRIGILSENRIELYYFILACWKLGIVVVPVSTRYSDHKLINALNSINCNYLLVSNSLKRDVSSFHVHTLEDFISCPEYETASIIFEQLDLNHNDDASILFTSGSSGEPKGVLHTIGNHYYSALGAFQNIPFDQGDRWLMSLPMYHISGFSLVMRSLICGGAVIFLQEGESLLDAVINRNITHLSLVPVQFNQLMQIPHALTALQQCKSVLLGGAMAGENLINNAFDQDILLSTTYGSTEVASQVTTTMPQTLKEKPNTSGKILPYRELKIASDGEILLKGKTLCRGYVLGSEIKLPLDQQGWFHTGDIGSLDNQGLLTVVGRKDRMFISGGENIHPEEIEKALINFNSIELAYIVPVSDAPMGQRPVAFIKASDSAAIDDEDLSRQLKFYLEKFKIPIAFLPWPQSDSGELKPDDRLFRSIALKAMTEKDNS